MCWHFQAIFNGCIDIILSFAIFNSVWNIGKTYIKSFRFRTSKNYKIRSINGRITAESRANNCMF